ncbi:MAG: hypothetical protein K6U00_09490 [Armatimonadetes bacterium]|nr:hypothetical protein [Armatimonadota bacterium]
MTCFTGIFRRVVALVGLHIMTFILLSVIAYSVSCFVQRRLSVDKWDKVPNDAPLLVLKTSPDGQFPSAKIIRFYDLARYGKEQGYFYVVPRGVQSAINKRLARLGGSVRVIREGDGWQFLEVISSCPSFTCSCWYYATDCGAYPVFARIGLGLHRRILAAIVPAFVVNVAGWVVFGIIIVTVRAVRSLFRWGKTCC